MSMAAKKEEERKCLGLLFSQTDELCAGCADAQECATSTEQARRIRAESDPYTYLPVAKLSAWGADVWDRIRLTPPTKFDPSKYYEVHPVEIHEEAESWAKAIVTHLQTQGRILALRTLVPLLMSPPISIVEFKAAAMLATSVGEFLKKAGILWEIGTLRLSHAPRIPRVIDPSTQAWSTNDSLSPITTSQTPTESSISVEADLLDSTSSLSSNPPATSSSIRRRQTGRLVRLLQPPTKP